MGVPYVDAPTEAEARMFNFFYLIIVLIYFIQNVQHLLNKEKFMQLELKIWM